MIILFTERGPAEIDEMFKISAKGQEFANYQYEILSGLKEPQEGNCTAEMTLTSKETH